MRFLYAALIAALLAFLCCAGPARAVSTSTITVSTNSYVSLGTGPLAFSVVGNPIQYQVADTQPSAGSLGTTVIPGGPAITINTQSQMWAMAPAGAATVITYPALASGDSFTTWPSMPSINAVYACDPTKTYWVGPSGNDANTATQAKSPTTPWATVAHAVANFGTQTGLGGTCINVLPGTYTEGQIYANALSGTAASLEGYFVVRSAVWHAAHLILEPSSYGTASGVVTIDSSQYVIFDGFEVSAVNSASYVRNGFSIISASAIAGNTPSKGTHHIQILNNLVHDVGGSCIGTSNSDYITYQGNRVYNCDGQAQTSPMTIWCGLAYDTAVGFHNVVSSNIAYDSVETYAHTHTEAVGFALDTLDIGFNNCLTSTYNNQAGFTGYTTQATLIENNVIYGNGGACIYDYYSDYATIRFNSCAWNEADTAENTFQNGGIMVEASNNSTVANNMVYQNPATVGANRYCLVDNTLGRPESGNTWSDNIAWNGTWGQDCTFSNGTTIVGVNGNLIGIDPRFNNPPSDLSLQAGSPGIGSATPTYGVPARDIRGKSRAAAPYDAGALVFAY